MISARVATQFPIVKPLIHPGKRYSDITIIANFYHRWFKEACLPMNNAAVPQFYAKNMMVHESAEIMGGDYPDKIGTKYRSFLVQMQ
jgi:hypothetical protein